MTSQVEITIVAKSGEKLGNREKRTQLAYLFITVLLLPE